MKLLFAQFIRVTPLHLLPCLAFGLLMASCAAYRQNIMFKTEGVQKLQGEVIKAEKNYTIQQNDYLQIDLYTNSGERIIDPDLKLAETVKVQGLTLKPEVKYLVDLKGVVKLPMIGEIKVEGMTLREVETLLQKAYEKYYTAPYAIVTYLNKRVIVLGAPGGQVIPLENENVPLVEILALSKGVETNGKAHNIRVIRGDQVFVADFSTIDGFRNSNMIMEPGDIVYVEPVRKPFLEAARDYGSLLGMVTSIVTLIIVISQ